jgi:hypothetical protein
MCDRLTQFASGDEIAKLCGLAEAPDLPPRSNVAATQPVTAVRWMMAGGLVLLRRACPDFFGGEGGAALVA